MSRYKVNKKFVKRKILKGKKLGYRIFPKKYKGRWKARIYKKKDKLYSFFDKIFIPLIVVDVFVAICFFVTYGVQGYKDFLITTAMTTQSHKYLARTFYNDDTISKVLSNNKVQDFTEGTDTSKVMIGNLESITYASSYEKEILEHNESEDYKMIKFTYNGYPCYIIAIYDPTRVSLMQSTYIGYYGQTLRDMARDNGAKVAINAGGFYDIDASGTVGMGNGGMPAGVVIKNGKVVAGNGNAATTIAGFNNDGILTLSYTTGYNAIKNGMKDAVQFNPFLIVNGVSATISGNGGWGINPRTVLAQRQDGVVLFFIADGNGANKYNWAGRGGLSMTDVVAILERYGAYNAVNMDGGASTTLVVNNQLINNPCGYSASGERGLPNGWMFK